MTETDADPLSPRTYCRYAVERLRREIAEIHAGGACQPRDVKRLAEVEHELRIAEAELRALELRR